MAVLQEIIEKIKQGERFLIAGHVNPDGDSVGSGLALLLGLQKMGKKVAFFAEQVPDRYSFLPAFDQITDYHCICEDHFDTMIALDCATLARLGQVCGHATKLPMTINIDHHASNECFGDLIWVEPEVAATAEMVYELIKALGIEMTNEIATCLYTGLLTDTGCYKNASTTSSTHAISAELIDAGVNSCYVVKQLFENRDLDYTRLLIKIINTLEVSDDGKVAWLTICQDVGNSYTEQVETEEVIGFALGVRGVEVALFFKEVDDSTVRVSLRAGAEINVSDIAQSFDGGGHDKAAGCTINLSLNKAMEAILAVTHDTING